MRCEYVFTNLKIFSECNMSWGFENPYISDYEDEYEVWQPGGFVSYPNELVKKRSSPKNYIHSGHPETLEQFNFLPKEAIIEIILNTHPKDLPGLCTGNKRVGEICRASIVKKRYVEKWGKVKKSPTKRGSREKKVNLQKSLATAMENGNIEFFVKWYPQVGYGDWVKNTLIFNYALTAASEGEERPLRMLIKEHEIRDSYLVEVMETQEYIPDDIILEILQDRDIKPNEGGEFVLACRKSSVKVIKEFLAHPNLEPSEYQNGAIANLARRGLIDLVIQISKHPKFEATVREDMTEND